MRGIPAYGAKGIGMPSQGQRNRSRRRSTNPPVSLPIETLKSAVGPLSVAACAEKDDDYPSLVAHLNSDWRVIVCREGIQWILQKRKGRSSGRPEWRSRSFCRTRDGLFNCICENCGPVDDAVSKIVTALPERKDSE